MCLLLEIILQDPLSLSFTLKPRVGVVPSLPPILTTPLAADAIAGVEVGGVPPVARADARLTIFLHSSKSDRTVYEGPLFLTVLSSNGSQLTASYSLTDGQDELQMVASRDQPTNSEKRLTVLASNHVSSLSVDTVVVLASEWPFCVCHSSSQ